MQQLSSLLVTLVRHGESQDNLQSIWAGFRDSPLSATGSSQARALGQSFANVALTAIYCSDLKRAAMTAEEILQANRSIPPPPLVQSKSLREQNFGQAEGQSWAAAEWTAKSQSDEARTFRFKDGESLDDVNCRMAKAVRQFVLPRVEALRRQNPPSTGSPPHICIVAHGIAIAELLRVFMSLHDTHPTSPWADPRLSYKRVRLDNTGWSRLELSVPQAGSEAGRPTPQPSPLPTNPQPQAAGSASVARPPPAEGDHLDSGAIQTEMVEGPSEAPKPSQVGNLEPSSAHKLTFVRVLCQNQIEHLRAFAMQPSSLSGGGATHALAGGLPAGTAPGTSSPSPANLGSATGASGSAERSMPIPNSGTMASIASNATVSTSASNATLPPPSTPGTAPAAAGPRSLHATPASARSLNSYDSKMMARELERAGAAAMLSGTESGMSGPSGGGQPNASTSASHVHPIGTHAPSTGTNTAPFVLERPGLQTNGTGLGALHSFNAGQASGSGGLLFNAYGGGGGGSGTSGPVGPSTSPKPSSLSFLNNPGANSDIWQGICVRVLPLFNGEGLRCSIEDLNDSVSQHVRRTLDRGPARALEALSLDLTSLAASGTLTLNSKLVGLEDVRLLVRLAEIWTFFLGQVLPYIEGCFLPFQTDTVLLSLASNARAVNAAAAAQSAAISPTIGTTLRIEKINVRKVLLAVFRDQVILPIHERLSHLFGHIGEIDPAVSGTEDAIGGDGSKQVYLRLLQMTSILASVLSDDEAQNVVDGLLRALRMGSKGTSSRSKNGSANNEYGLGMRALSPEQQRSNRRGWMAQRARKHGASSVSESFSLGSFGGGSSSAGVGGAHLPGHLGSTRSGSSRTVNRFGPGLSEEDYLTSLRSPNDPSALSIAEQRHSPTPPPGTDQGRNGSFSAPRNSEDSTRTAGPGEIPQDVERGENDRVQNGGETDEAPVEGASVEPADESQRNEANNDPELRPRSKQENHQQRNGDRDGQGEGTPMMHQSVRARNLSEPQLEAGALDSSREQVSLPVGN